ncbi:ATP-binding protein [Aeromonas hydrophila]
MLIAFEAQSLLLEIRDNGAGLRVPATELQQAFYSDKPDGMGLGLAICREVVESHRGQFSLENLSPHGCLARVILPVPPPEDPASATPTHSPTPRN